MNRADFDELAKATIGRTGGLLISKGAEYAGDGDRLANFKRNAEKNGQTILECWQIYWGKHVDSINSYMLRVKETAIRMALSGVEADIIAALKEDNGNKRADALNPVLFKNRVNNCLPAAIEAVEATLSEPIEGRFDDNINYSILCQAILKELRDDNA